jgi:hypothetical protein
VRSPGIPAARLALAAGIGALALLAGAGSLVASPAGPDVIPDETFGRQGPAYESMKAVRPVPSEVPSEEKGLALRLVPELVRLPAVDRDGLLREDAAAGRQGRAKALRYGVRRALRLSARDGDRYDLAGGARLWVGEIVSTGALGLRLHFQELHLPAGAELAVYSPTAETVPGVFRNGDPRFDPDRHVEIHQARTGDFWTGSFPGDRVRIEYLAPAGAAGEPPFTVDALQHLYLDPIEDLAKKVAGPCHNDVSCYPEWADIARAVSGVGFIDRDALFCTGELLDDLAGDFTPYWLTAHHCISSQAAALTAEVYWLYQTASCGGAPPSIQSVPHSLGATLLWTSHASDATLLMVEGALPAGLYWAGWTGEPVADGTDAAGIHHPSGDYKRISFGFKDEPSACRGLDPTISLVRVSWTDGPTERGSSGSGIFRADTHQLFGQLFDGPSACGRETYDCYGAFVSTYPKIKSFLRQGSDDDSEPNGSCAEARTVRPGLLRGRIVKLGGPDWYKILVPPGRSVNVRLAFSNARGDVDLAAFRSCSGEPAATSTGTSNAEAISLANPGSRPAFVYWQVYLDSDTRNGYDMTVSIR